MTSSPGRSPVELRDCIEELLRFTLASCVDGTLPEEDSTSTSNITLSRDYFLKLLQEDPSNTFPTDSTSLVEGVPPYPLFKRIAASLLHTIDSGTFLTTHQKSVLLNQNQNEDRWSGLLLEEGYKLQDILKSVDFELHVQEPYFTQLRDGQKTVEGRCAVGDYNKIDTGAIIFCNKSLLLQVQDVRRYATFSEMLEAESLLKVLPGVRTIEEGVQVYRNFYSEEKERSNGVLAICVKKPSSQLFNIMFSMLLGLGYEGIQRLLGFAQSVGTIPEALPPPISTLISSFIAPHRSDVKGSELTEGARALAKHADRSRDNYWGTSTGSDVHKNQLAVEIISRLITHCCWRNMHIVPPHGLVFEIRVAGGYGARWSGDGSKFIGFLEPYMVDGHSSGWKH